MIIPMIELMYGVWFMQGRHVRDGRGPGAAVPGAGRGGTHVSSRWSASSSRKGGRAESWWTGAWCPRPTTWCATPDFPYAMKEPRWTTRARAASTPTARSTAMDYSCSCFVLYLGLDKRYPVECRAFHPVRVRLRTQHSRPVRRRALSGRPLVLLLRALAHWTRRWHRRAARRSTCWLPCRRFPPTGAGPPGARRRRGGCIATGCSSLVETRDAPIRDVRDHIVCERVYTPARLRRAVQRVPRRDVRIAAHAAAEQLLAAAQQGARAASSLYFCGSSTHPGAGVPIVLLSAKLAVAGADARRPGRTHARRRCAMTAQDGFAERADDFAWCEEVIRRNSQQLLPGVLCCFPRASGAGVYALYAFCRVGGRLRGPR